VASVHVGAAPPKALVAEDETSLREELCEALTTLWSGIDICARASDGDEALRAWELYRPDVVFLDIRMPGRSGLDVAKRVSGLSHVVFVTAYEQYAVAAFEQGAVDYLLKPFEPARLAATIARLKQRLRATPASVDGLLRELAQRFAGQPDYLRWITASRGQEMTLITCEEICYFRAEQKYTVVATPERDALISRPIKELIEQLDPAVFWQIHRGTIVNIRHIAGVTRDYRGQLRVRLKQRKELLAVSAAHAHKFKQM
jgi:DNA-binding LytR/AlgR family response regulator